MLFQRNGGKNIIEAPNHNTVSVVADGTSWTDRQPATKEWTATHPIRRYLPAHETHELYVIGLSHESEHKSRVGSGGIT